MENFIFDHTSFNEFFTHLFQSFDILNQDVSDAAMLGTSMENMWSDVYENFAITVGSYDFNVNEHQDAIARQYFERLGFLPDPLRSHLLEVDKLQRALHDPIFRQENFPLNWSDADMKWRIHYLLNRWPLTQLQAA